MMDDALAVMLAYQHDALPFSGCQPSPKRRRIGQDPFGLPATQPAPTMLTAPYCDYATAVGPFMMQTNGTSGHQVGQHLAQGHGVPHLQNMVSTPSFPLLPRGQADGLPFSAAATEWHRVAPAGEPTSDGS